MCVGVGKFPVVIFFVFSINRLTTTEKMAKENADKKKIYIYIYMTVANGGLRNNNITIESTHTHRDSVGLTSEGGGCGRNV